MEGPKKISFGFSKQLKKPLSTPAKPPEEKVQFIDCLEGKSIKLRDGEEVEEKKQPLVIPLKDKTSTATVLARIAKEVEPDLQNEIKTELGENETQQPLETDGNESLEKKAVKELLEDAKNIKKKKAADDTLVVPLTEHVKITGEKESSLEDYDSIPINDFGMAMLRGMGWKEGQGIGKSNKNVQLSLPKLRPKGMGLGADKVAIETKQKDKSNGAPNEEELNIVKGAFVRIIAGKNSGTYGQISGFDEDGGRVIIKTAIGGTNISVNEFILQAVTKHEYSEKSKVINVAKYEEYKAKETEKSDYKTKIQPERNTRRETSRRNSDESSESEYPRDRGDRYNSNSRKIESSSKIHVSNRNEYSKNHRRNDSDSENEYYKSRNRKYDDKRRDRKEKLSDSCSDNSPPARSKYSPIPKWRDSDKKRKGKKKRRDRSRSKDRRRR